MLKEREQVFGCRDVLKSACWCQCFLDRLFNFLAQIKRPCMSGAKRILEFSHKDIARSILSDHKGPPSCIGGSLTLRCADSILPSASARKSSLMDGATDAPWDAFSRGAGVCDERRYPPLFCLSRVCFVKSYTLFFCPRAPLSRPLSAVRSAYLRRRPSIA